MNLWQPIRQNSQNLLVLLPNVRGIVTNAPRAPVCRIVLSWGPPPPLFFNDRPTSWAKICSSTRLLGEDGKLDYFELEVIDGVRTAIIPKRIIQQNQGHWCNTMVCYAIGHVIVFNWLKSFAARNWKLKGEFHIFPRANWFVIIEFALVEDCSNVLSRGPWFLNDHFWSSEDGRESLSLGRIYFKWSWFGFACRLLTSRYGRRTQLAGLWASLECSYLVT